ncbi:MAG: small, acid-soluble spore protein, alpha/beta type [Clostridia bacterium]|nr:small, acid-soluble spore protein, alpha/beta type [Clostridia bacterium]
MLTKLTRTSNYIQHQCANSVGGQMVKKMIEAYENGMK